MNPQNRYLVIVPGYPSIKHRYNNAFVHSRVKAYKQEGIQVDVFSVDQLGSSYEFDGIKVTVGSLKHLKEQLLSQQYTTPRRISNPRWSNSETAFKPSLNIPSILDL